MNSTITVDPLTDDVLAAAGIERAAVVAVVVNAALTEVVQPGFLTLYPSDAVRAEVSNLNMESPGQTLANVATVPVGPDGLIRAFNTTGGHLVLDVQGVYVSAATAAAGRLVMFTSPQRSWDSRDLGDSIAAGETRVLSLAGAGVPVSASAALLNVTVTGTAGAGFTTVWPANEVRPTASNVNVDRAGQTAANQVIVKVASSAINIYSMAGSDVIVDVAGYYTGSSARVTTNGLFVPFAPLRLLDTRLPAGSPPVAAGSTLYVDTRPPSAGVIPIEASAVAANLTITEPVAAGFVTAFPSRVRPETSSINASHAGQTVANHAVIGMSGSYLHLYTLNATHIVADASGYFTAAIPAPVPGDPPTDPLPPGGPPNLALDFNFMYYDDAEGYPTQTMDPCERQVTYRIDAGGSTPEQRALVAGVVTKVEAASGFDLVYLGPVADDPYDADINLSFSSGASMGEYVVYVSHFKFSFPGIPGGEGSDYIGKASVSVNESATDPAAMTAYLLWVFAAALGLGTADGPDQAMSSPIGGPYLDDYATGDREGLRLLGYRNC